MIKKASYLRFKGLWGECRTFCAEVRQARYALYLRCRKVGHCLSVACQFVFWGRKVVIS